MRLSTAIRGAAVIACAGTLAAPAAASAESATGPFGPGAFDFTDDHPGKADVDQLRAKLRKPDDRVRVFVTLRMKWEPPAKTSTPQAAALRRTVQTARERAIGGLGSSHLQLRRTFGNDLPTFSADVDAHALTALAKSPAVARIREVGRLKTADVQSNITQAVTSAHAIGASGSGWTVAVIDTGVDIDHENFGGRVLDGACFTSSPYPATAGDCGPQYNQNTYFGPNAGDACPYNFNNDCHHGTHVAGIAAGANQIHGYGIAYGATVLPVKAGSKYCNIFGANCDIVFWDDDVVTSMQYVAEEALYSPIAAVNLSLGSEDLEEEGNCSNYDASYNSVVELLRQRGVAVVFSSGNAGSREAIGFPACVPGTVRVASVNNFDGVSNFSNVGPGLTMFAVGDDVDSSFRDGWGRMGGTSMAAPQVAGAIAVIRKLHPAKHDFSVDALVKHIRDTGDPVTDRRSGGSFSGRRLNLTDAVRMLWAKQLITHPMDGYQIPRFRDSDFDGDGVKDLAVFRPSTGYWDIRSGRTKEVLISEPFGEPGDVPVPGYYDGDNKADLAVYRAREGKWFIWRSTDGVQQDPIPFGEETDTPVPADYDGDGETDIAVYRRRDGFACACEASWYYKASSNSNKDVGPVRFGLPTDIPAPGNWTGNGKRADIAVFRPHTGQWLTRRMVIGGYSTDTFAFGTMRDVPVPADYDNDGKIDAAVYRPTDQKWYHRRSRDRGMPPGYTFGEPNDVQIPGNYEADAGIEYGVYRITDSSQNGTWFWEWPPANYTWGAKDAIPLR